MDLNPKIIPDVILDLSYCKKCLRYLSVSPIGIHENGGNICGRCIANKEMIPSSTLFICDLNFVTPEDIPFGILGHITRDSLFPCINRFDGCRELLSFSGIERHEEICRKKVHLCPCGFRGIGSQLVVHFKTVHNKFLCEEDSRFSLDMSKDFSDVYLYRQEDMLFLIRTEYVKETNQHFLETKCLIVENANVRIRVELETLYQEKISVLSDIVSIFSGATFSITLKIDDVHICEAATLKCDYKILIIR
ncbi:unnamed protein product [Acanthoscelides obtectus]|uniref:SIAH-type domain-containing protein n=1 Tax=Acanthoscelides obtectus TaxID=200917 RepID=A0A9P0KRG0_ACAOB|nr:unnamed protein product [Acanthoscelides obtectus]CAK1665181.1 hypothetical protein AOBTE_LOCUS24699 [Acanthoscelides obtectus]